MESRDAELKVDPVQLVLADPVALGLALLAAEVDIKVRGLRAHDYPGNRTPGRSIADGPVNGCPPLQLHNCAALSVGRPDLKLMVPVRVGQVVVRLDTDTEQARDGSLHDESAGGRFDPLPIPFDRSPHEGQAKGR